MPSDKVVADWCFDYVNHAPILWYSKRQNTVETSTFGSEFVAAGIAVEIVEGLAV